MTDSSDLMCVWWGWDRCDSIWNCRDLSVRSCECYRMYTARPLWVSVTPPAFIAFFFLTMRVHCPISHPPLLIFDICRILHLHLAHLPFIYSWPWPSMPLRSFAISTAPEQCASTTQGEWHNYLVHSHNWATCPVHTHSNPDAPMCAPGFSSTQILYQIRVLHAEHYIS